MAKKYEYGVALTNNKGIDEKHVRVFETQKDAEEDLAKCGDGHCLVKREVSEWKQEKKLKFGFPKMVQVHCRMVKVKDVVPWKNQTKSQIKAHAECGEWYFPCKSYKYNDIKAELEKGICEICGAESVNVTDFSTDIVEFDDK